jgi:hypothetical protein
MDSYTVVAYRDEQCVDYGWGDRTTICNDFKIRISVDEKTLEDFLTDELTELSKYYLQYSKDRFYAQKVWIIRNGTEILAEDIEIDQLEHYIEDPTTLNIYLRANTRSKEAIEFFKKEEARKVEEAKLSAAKEQRERKLRELENLKKELGLA